MTRTQAFRMAKANKARKFYDEAWRLRRALHIPVGWWVHSTEARDAQRAQLNALNHRLPKAMRQ